MSNASQGKVKQRPASEHVIVIQPNRSWFRIPWREVLEYRGLIGLLVRRDFVATYKQTVLGPTWYIIQPLTQTVIFTVIFGHVAKISTDGMPKILFYLCGTLGWSYFARCMGGTSSSLVGNAGVFGKVYFPRLVMPISQVITGLIGFCIQLTTFLCFWLYFKFFTEAGCSIHMSPAVVVLPVFLVQSAAIGLGVGLLISSLTAKYRDFGLIFGYITRLWMYATPIVYPLSIVPERWRWVSAINPMTATVESFRYLFLGTGIVRPMFFISSVCGTLVLLLIGVMAFSRAERTFIDTV